MDRFLLATSSSSHYRKRYWFWQTFWLNIACILMEKPSFWWIFLLKRHHQKTASQNGIIDWPVNILTAKLSQNIIPSKYIVTLWQIILTVHSPSKYIVTVISSANFTCDGIFDGKSFWVVESRMTLGVCDEQFWQSLSQFLQTSVKIVPHNITCGFHTIN